MNVVICPTCGGNLEANPGDNLYQGKFKVCGDCRKTYGSSGPLQATMNKADRLEREVYELKQQLQRIQEQVPKLLKSHENSKKENQRMNAVIKYLMKSLGGVD